MDTLITQKQTPDGMIGGLSGKISVKLIIGIFFTILGVLLTLDNLDLADADRFLAWWPLVIVAIGILKLQNRRSRIPAAFAIGIGTLMVLNNTDWLSFSIFDLWPIALVIAGIGIVAHAVGFRAPTLFRDSGSTVWAVLGVRKITVDSRNYTGGRIMAFMGGCELDLTKADMETGPASIELIAVWGGIEIKVPEGWEVVGNMVPIMGGADIRTKAAPGGRRLNVTGLAIMGGVDIKSVAAEAV
jgi:predicted membrane protein